MTLTSLSSLKPGQKALILAIGQAEDGDEFQLRLHEMGFDEGLVVEVVHRGLFGDPIAVNLDGVTIALRRADAAHIQVGPLAERQSEAAE